MTQEATPEPDPIEEYWASHRNSSSYYGKHGEWLRNANSDGQRWLDLRDEFGRTMDQIEFAQTNGWASGRYAFAALAAGLIIMVLLSIPAGARPIIAVEWLPPEPITVETWEPAPIEIIDLGPSVSEMELDMQRNTGECRD